MTHILNIKHEARCDILNCRLGRSSEFKFIKEIFFALNKENAVFRSGEGMKVDLHECYIFLIKGGICFLFHEENVMFWGGGKNGSCITQMPNKGFCLTLSSFLWIFFLPSDSIILKTRTTSELNYNLEPIQIVIKESQECAFSFQLLIFFIYSKFFCSWQTCVCRRQRLCL